MYSFRMVNAVSVFDSKNMNIEAFRFTAIEFCGLQILFKARRIENFLLQ